MKFPDLTPLVNPDDKELIKAIVTVLSVLRQLDKERIQHLLSQVSMTKAIFPKELQAAIEMLEVDFTLILAFIDQATKYDRTDDAMKSGEWLFGNYMEGGDERPETS